VESQAQRRIAGRYRLLEPIGQGGMGVVWKAHDELIDRVVAVKEVLHRAVRPEDREKFNQRTIREARAAGRLSHPNVVVVHDVIEEDDRPWIVMQLVHARSLGEAIKSEGPLPPERVAAIGAQVLDALRTAHAAGVLHRDVKPENVLIGDDGRVVLTDFGIATMTQETALTVTGAISGTPAFMPPERLNGLPAVPESDLWSLGATLYAAVEGHPPFDRGAPVPTMAAILHDQPRPMRRAGPLAPVIDGLLRKDPATRMGGQQAEELLRQVAAGGAPAAYPPREERTPAGFDARHAQQGYGPPGADGGTRPGLGGYGTDPGADPRRHGAPGHGPQAPWGTPPDGRTTPTLRPARRFRGGLVAAVAGVPATLALAGGIVLYALGESADSAGGETVISVSTPVEGGSTPSDAVSPTPSPAASSPAPDSRPTPTSASPSDDDVPVPEGWRLHRDRGGFTIALPRDWREFDRQATSVKFRGPGSRGYLHIDWTEAEEPIRDPVRAWRDLERRVLDEGKFDGYRRVRMEPVRYLGLQAADWEFTWRASSGTVHVLNRGFRTEDGKPFAIYWQTPDGEWADDVRFLRAFHATFRPS